MGSGASVPSASSGDIAKHVASLGEPYEGYAQKIEADGVDGEFLASIEAKDLPDLFTAGPPDSPPSQTGVLVPRNPKKSRFPF